VADYLVKLYDIPPIGNFMEKVNNNGITIRRPIGPEKYAVIEWIEENFNLLWAGEAENAFFKSPKSIFIAIDDERNKMLGFACYDATAKGFFGPTGVAKEARGAGIGGALLMASLYSMRDEGYGYAIIGGVGPVEFYEKICGATLIEGSSPDIYKGMQRAKNWLPEKK
jgi:GNAT superfamily N-acetyltransferase